MRFLPGRGGRIMLVRVSVSLAEIAMAASTHEQKRDLFQSHFLLGKLEPGEIDTLATRARVESYRAGQEIFAKGSPGRTMIAVLQGSVKIVSLSPTGKEVVVHAGEVFGELAVITGEERSAGAAAMTDCELLIIDRRDVLPMFERHFEICMMLIQSLYRRLRQTGEQVEDVLFRSRGLEARVAEQVEELGRVGRLKRFLPPQLAELIVSQGDEKILESHRREIVVVFCDLRGYTAFTETAEPEDQFEFLRQYHGALGPLITEFEGTLDHFSGDGIMVFFNDPVPCPNPAERAVKMAIAMREAAGKLIAAWRLHGCELGFGASIAQGYATLGQIGFSERSSYTAIGTVCNLAARLCAEAKDGQILLSSRIAEAVKSVAKLEDLGNLELKGFRRPVAAFNVAQSTSAADARPNLTVVASNPRV
jgi:adenylate cyclase